MTSYSDEQVAMTLAAIAYSHELIGSSTIKDLLADTGLATQGRWSLVWGPHKKETNQAYVVQQGATGNYALAIRGTAPIDPFSWLLDLETELEDLPFSCSRPDAQISKGMVKAFDHLTTMPDLGTKLGTFIQDQIPSDSTLWVTGHSQGGALASVMALWAAVTFPGLTVVPYTFAGETAGNQGFATAFERAFHSSGGGRYANKYDFVPRAFQDLSRMPNLYHEYDIPIPSDIQDWINKNQDLEGEYVQPLPRIEVSTHLVPPNPDHREPDKEYLEEALAQHNHIGYLYSMGAPYAPIDPGYSYPTHLDH